MLHLPFRLRAILATGTALSCMAATAYAQMPGMDPAPELVTLEEGSRMQQPAPPQDAAENATVTWQGSLMFPEDKVKALMEIYRAYLAKVSRTQPQVAGEAATNVLDDTLKLLTQEPEEISPEIYHFSLNSILYDDTGNWSIWVNGQRHNKKQALEGFAVNGSNVMVTDVTKRRITFIWMPHPRSFDLIMERWERRQQAGEQADNTQIAKDAQVGMDSIGQKITVTLGPNQTFLSDSMTVLEGVRHLRSPALPAADAAMSGEGTVEDAMQNIEPEAPREPVIEEEAPVAPPTDREPLRDEDLPGPRELP